MMSYLNRAVRYPAVYAVISAGLVMLAMSAVAWMVNRNNEAALDLPLLSTLGSYAATLEGGTTNSRAMGAAILFGQESQEAKQLVRGKLPPGAPSVMAVLDKLRQSYLAETVLLVDKRGMVVAYSNQDHISGIGRDLSFRPYVQQALQGFPNVYAAVGSISVSRGIFLSAPLRATMSDTSEPIGAMVIKIGADKLDLLLKSWSDGIALLLSPQGVVFAASRDDWLFHIAGEASAERLAEIRRSRQFGEALSLQSLPFTLNQTEASIDGVRYAVRSQLLEWNDPAGEWRLAFLERRAPWWTRWNVLGFAGLAGVLVSLLLFGFYILARNALQLENMNAQLRRNDELLEESQRIAGLGSYTLDIPSGVWKSSVILDRLFGIDARYERTVSGWAALIHPDERAMMIDYFRNEVLGQGKVFHKEHRIIRHDDRVERWVQVRGKLERDVAGRLLKLYGTVQDITERKQDEQQLSSLLAFNRTILEKSPSGIAVYRSDGPCVMANEAYAKTLGTTAENILKQDFRHNESWRRNGLLGYAEQAFATGAALRRDVDGSTSFGKHVVLECVFAPVSISGAQHLLVITNDISARVAAEQALKESMHKLEEKELAKTRFLAAAGHDLRQPLAAANLFIDALKLTELTAGQDTIVQRLDQAMATFNGLLETLLNISKLDAGAIQPEYIPIRVSELFGWLEQNFAQMVSEKQLGFRLYFPMKEALVVRSDIGLLRSILMNLVSNALKFTSQGAILVSARRRGGEVLFQVWDTGMGISPEDIAHIYDEFYQVDNPQRDRTRGLGLGLAIVKRALSLLGGTITCRSRLGHGTVFEFRLPLNDTPRTPTSLAATVATQGDVDQDAFLLQDKRFILVEDDALVSQAMISLLEGMGGEVKHFHSAEDALRHADIGYADYFISDYMLSGKLNGIQFLNQVRQKLGRPINGVLMTGDTSPAFLAASTDCAWAVLHKPINLSMLLSRLREYES